MADQNGADWEDIQGKKYPGYGRCIYCGSDGGSDGLRDEHIIPYSLGGNTTIENASCGDCERRINPVDTHMARAVFGEDRLHAGLHVASTHDRRYDTAQDGAEDAATEGARGHCRQGRRICMKNPTTHFALNVGRFILSLSLSACLPGEPSLSAETAPLVLQSQGSFFVGGHDVHSDTLSTIPEYFDPVGTFTVDQMYVHYEIPVARVKRYPITFVHGCCLTGKSWEETPDGRMGWDDFFVRKGYPVYVVDQAERGRSATYAVAIPATKLGVAKPDDLPNVLSPSHEASWRIFRFGPKYPDVYPGLQFPLEAKVEFWKQMVPDWNSSLPKPNPTVMALGELADRLDGTILVSHSQSGIYPFLTAASGDHKIAAIVAIEPACPAATDPMTPFTKFPIMVLWGDNVERSPIWAPRAVACDAFVAAVNKAGGHADVVRLPSLGFHGNSHMLMMDKNSLEVADWLAGYMDTHFPKPN